MDITINVDDYKLNMRAAVVIIHNGKILVHKNIKSDHYALLGGRVEIGEASNITVKREVKEELGKEIEILGYIATIENFFTMKGNKYHEIEFIYQAEFANDVDKLIKETMKNTEGKEYLQYEWIDINSIDEYKILPEIAKKIIKEGKFPVHEINDEISFVQSLWKARKYLTKYKYKG